MRTSINKNQPFPQNRREDKTHRKSSWARNNLQIHNRSGNMCNRNKSTSLTSVSSFKHTRSIALGVSDLQTWNVDVANENRIRDAVTVQEGELTRILQLFILKKDMSHDFEIFCFKEGIRTKQELLFWNRQKLFAQDNMKTVAYSNVQFFEATMGETKFSLKLWENTGR